MTSEKLPETRCWYVLNHVGGSSTTLAQKSVDLLNASEHTDLELFAPTYVVREERDGAVRFRTANLTFHYVFVRGTFADVKLLCSRSNGFSFLIDHGSAERYAVIDDRKMVNFKNIARAYKNCLPYFPIEEVDLEDGDLVEVVKGDFPGLIGTFMPNPRSKSGNIVLNVYNKVGTIAFNVKATDVRVLEFSRKSTRANDQIDAIVPRLLEALRHYDRDEELPSALAARLSIFCSRMAIARLNNRKLDARLQALLYTANRMLGNIPEAREAIGRYDKVKDAVTNPWTIALNELMFAVIDRDKSRLLPSAGQLAEIDASSRAKDMLRDEYRHYLSSATAMVHSDSLPCE